MQVAIGRFVPALMLVLASAGWSVVHGADAPPARLTRVAAGLSGPTALAAPDDGSGRL